MREAVIAAVQTLAISRKVWCGSETELLALLAPSLQMPLDSIKVSLYEEETRRLLFLRDVALWHGADKRFRVVDQQPPDSPAHAVRFLNLRVDGRVCAFCKLDDADHELRSFYPGAWIHELCQRAWYRWRRSAFAAERAARSPKSVSWWQVLGLNRPNATRKEINAAFKRAAMKDHPDRGGTDERMTALNHARDEGLSVSKSK